MKRTKRILAAALILTLLLALCACGGSKTPASNSGTPSSDSGEKAPASTGSENGGGEAADPIVINIVSTFPAGNVNYEAGVLIADKVAELTGGKIRFNFLGGSEIFSGSAGAEAVMNGALDAVFTAADYFTGFVPEAAAICASDMTFEEMTASGGLDYLNGIFEEQGVHLLYVVDEVGISGTQIFTNQPITSLDDLKGMSIRTTGTVQGNILSSLGCVATPLGLPEIFSGLEQGLVQGYCGPAYLGGAMGFFEYCKGVVSTEIARGGSSLLINAEVWASIPAETQQLLIDALPAINEAEVALYTEYVTNNRQMLLDAGGQVVELSAEEAAELSSLSMDYAWESIESSVDAEVYSTLHELFLK